MSRKKLIQVRSDTAANWAATNPVLAIGEPYFVTDTGESGYGTGVAFNSRPQLGASSAQMRHMTVDQANSTLVLADVTQLTFPVVAAGIYAFEFELFVHTAATTTGLVCAVNGPASPTYVQYTFFSAISNTQINTAGTNTLDTVIVASASLAVAAAPLPNRVVGYLVNGVNAGTLALRFRSEVDASAVTIHRGSWGRLTRIA